jgi:hypothetical protein
MMTFDLTLEAALELARLEAEALRAIRRRIAESQLGQDFIDLDESPLVPRIDLDRPEGLG